MKYFQKVTHFFIPLLLITFNFTNAQVSKTFKNGIYFYSVDSSKIVLQNISKFIEQLNSQEIILSSNWRIDSLYAVNEQVPVYKSVFSYEDGKVKTRETFLNSNSGWLKSDLQIYEYDENGNMILNIQKDWVNNSWKDYARAEYGYNDDGDEIFRISQFYDGSEWIKISQSLSDYYDSNHKETLGQYYSDGHWKNDSFLKDYNARGEFYEKSVLQLWNDNENNWENYMHVTREFNDQDQIISILAQVWQNEKWEDNFYYEYIYNELEQLAAINHYEFTGNNRNLVSHQLYNYDGNNNLAEIVNENLVNEEWAPGTDAIVVNFGNGYLVGYDGVYKVRLFQSNITDVKGNYNLSKEFSLSQNYPNPFNPSTKIRFTMPNVETPYRASLQTKLTVYDILGREVKTLINKNLSPGNYEVTFNGSDLTSGVYFYVLETGEKRLSRKMLLIK